MDRNGILLLGGAGFMGTALSQRLAQEGAAVTVVTAVPPAVTVPGVAYRTGDLGNASLLEELLSRCGTLVHMASTSTPGSSARHPAWELDNIVPALHLLEHLHGQFDKHLVFISSGGTVYGNPPAQLIDETTHCAPLSYHGAGKVAIEAFLNAFRAAGHAVTVLRPANAYGPGQFLEQGFGLVRTALQHALNGTTLELWGDGGNIRDFLYIDDLVDAIARAVHAPHDRGTYNVGSGTGYSLNQVVELARQISGLPLHVEYQPGRWVDAREVVLDNQRIRAALGWQPTVGLEEGMRRTWTWLKEGKR